MIFRVNILIVECFEGSIVEIVSNDVDDLLMYKFVVYE